MHLNSFPEHVPLVSVIIIHCGPFGINVEFTCEGETMLLAKPRYLVYLTLAVYVLFVIRARFCTFVNVAVYVLFDTIT